MRPQQPSPSNPQDQWGAIQNTFGSGVEWLFRLMPGMRGKLYGRSLMPPCRCEACAYTLDTLIMYLDEDTMGWYTPDDIQHIMMDRFCYGIKWLYRSACHHIMSNYYEDVTDMVMTYDTGWDICRQLRFCPWFLNDPLNANDASPRGSARPPCRPTVVVFRQRTNTTDSTQSPSASCSSYFLA